MDISFIEVQNFRRFKAIRIDFHHERTIFVGANNSGKTSAMLALGHFLYDQRRFTTNDFTLSNWAAIEKIAHKWASHDPASGPPPCSLSDWDDLLPSMDVWLNVASNEIHHVSHLLPTLDWAGGLIGVRLRLEPEDMEAMYKEYLVAFNAAKIAKLTAAERTGKEAPAASLWPASMREFLARRMKNSFTVRSYSLDPQKVELPVKGAARPQKLTVENDPLEKPPFENLIKIDEIGAQRGLGISSHHEPTAGGDGDGRGIRGQHKLSDQLRVYYARHLDPSEFPEAEDLAALEAIENAQRQFDDKLKIGFAAAITEIQNLGYPGIADPRLTICTRLQPTDGLQHAAAVQYEVIHGAPEQSLLRLPEDHNGLGYQNLIYMVFRLMSFRDNWMRVGKVGKSLATNSKPVPPLHLVLIEEPETHLHAQVQQVFIRKAYAILRNNDQLGTKIERRTQLVVSTHSSHVAHECEFGSLRYFRRLPAKAPGEVPTSAVVSLSTTFGKDDDTAKFVTRYLTAVHSDLFFADAAIFIEGSAERMLVPHFIKNAFSELDKRYITLLEIGGSHAHRLRPLVDHLGLTTLIITDIDSASAAGRHPSHAPQRNADLITRNTTLKEWLPRETSLDRLLDMPDARKVVGDGEFHAVRVAYQCPTMVNSTEPGHTIEVLAHTFEGALILENLAFFRACAATAALEKVSALVNQTVPESLTDAVFAHVNLLNKAEFALDLIYAAEPAQLQAPTYISIGLAWLQSQVQRQELEAMPQDAVKTVLVEPAL